MSASAEVYVSVDDHDAKHEAGKKIDEIVEAAFAEVCIPTTGSSYAVSRMNSGVIFESRGHSVAWDVFQEDFAKGIVKKLHDLDDGLDVEVYVYNLEREADASYTTMRLGSEKGDEDSATHRNCEECGSRTSDWYVADNNGLKTERVYCPECEEIRSEKYGCAMIISQGASCEDGACGCGGTGSYDEEDAV